MNEHGPPWWLFLALAAPVALVLVLSLVVSRAAHAQLVEPSDIHYLSAIEHIATQRAIERVLQAEQVIAIALPLIKAELAKQRQRDALVNRFLEEHGRKVREWAGMPAPLPGDGWHVVHRHD